MKKGMFITQKQKEYVRHVLQTTVAIIRPKPLLDFTKDLERVTLIASLLESNQLQKIDGELKAWLVEQITKRLLLHQENTARLRLSFTSPECDKAAGKTKTMTNLLYKLSQCPQ